MEEKRSWLDEPMEDMYMPTKFSFRTHWGLILWFALWIIPATFVFIVMALYKFGVIK